MGVQKKKCTAREGLEVIRFASNGNCGGVYDKVLKYCRSVELERHSLSTNILPRSAEIYQGCTHTL